MNRAFNRANSNNNNNSWQKHDSNRYKKRFILSTPIHFENNISLWFMKNIMCHKCASNCQISTHTINSCIPLSIKIALNDKTAELLIQFSNKIFRNIQHFRRRMLFMECLVFNLKRTHWNFLALPATWPENFYCDCLLSLCEFYSNSNARMVPC